MAPPIVVLPVPFTTSVPALVFPLIVTPLKVVKAVLLTVRVRELAPAVERLPFTVNALVPPMVSVPLARETLLAIVRAPPPACSVPLELKAKVPVPSALLFPTTTVVPASLMFEPLVKLFVPSNSIVPVPLKLSVTAFVLETVLVTSSRGHPLLGGEDLSGSPPRLQE